MHIKGDTLYEMWSNVLLAYFDGRLKTHKASGRDAVFNLSCSSPVGLGKLRPEMVGYSPAKLSILTTSYVPIDQLLRLKHTIRDAKSHKLQSYQFNFHHVGRAAERRDGCLVSLIAVIRPRGKITITVAIRASELVRTFVGDLCLMHQIARVLFPESDLARVELRFNIAYGYFNATKAIALLGHPLFEHIEHPLLAKARREATASSSKLMSIQRLLNFHRGRVGHSGSLSTLF